MALASVKETVPGLLQTLSLTSGHFAALCAVEQQLSQFGGGVRVAGFKGNKIYVEAESPVQLAELSFRKRELIKMMRSALSRDEGQPDPEIKFFLKGAARPTRQETLQSWPKKRAFTPRAR